MIERMYENKLCVAGKLQREIIAAGLPVDPSPNARFYGIYADCSGIDPFVKILLYDDITQQETDIVDTCVANHVPTPLIQETVIRTVGPDFITGAVSDVYVIPSGKVLYIQKFKATSCACSDKSTRTDLYYDPAGNGIGMTVIDVIYCFGNASQHTLDNISYAGDGTAAIRTIRNAADNTSNNMFCRWEGYYE